MNHDEEPFHSARSTFLTILLLAVVASGFVVFFTVAMGAFFLQALAMTAGVAALGFVHYLLWGRSLSKSVAREREEAEAEQEQEADANGWQADEPNSPRRY